MSKRYKIDIGHVLLLGWTGIKKVLEMLWIEIGHDLVGYATGALHDLDVGKVAKDTTHVGELILNSHGVGV